MEITYSIKSDFWFTVYYNLFAKNGFHVPNNLTRADLEQILYEQDGIEVVRDEDGRWIAVKLSSQEEAVKLMLTYGQ